MEINIIISILIAIITGVIFKYILIMRKSQLEITWKEFAIVSIIISCVIIPVTIFLGFRVAKSNLMSFNEYWNGWEIKAEVEEIKCTRDGSCKWEYNCDPYTVKVSYSCNCRRDSKGRETCSTCYRDETRYHECPYVDSEYNYTVITTIGSYDIDDHRLPVEPNNHRWRIYKDVPDGVIESAGCGEPPFWKKVKDRIINGVPGPVTKRASYDNYILASEHNILGQYSGDIQTFKSKNLLPIFQKGIKEFYYADKVYFVGFKPKDFAEWYTNLNYFNATLGALKGDLHLVLVKGNVDINTYALALKAYWQNSKELGKDALSKNAIVVILLTDGNKVLQVQSFTGMPVGNELMLTTINDRLKNVDLNPDIVIGDVSGVLHNGNIVFKHGKGVLENVIFGLENKSTQFKRVSMLAKDSNDVGSGFLYLSNEIQPTTGQIIGIHIFAFVCSCIGWLFAIIRN